MRTLPYQIKAKDILKGDRVRINLPANQGVLHTIEGIVHKIELSGGVTYYYTVEGANILAYYPGISGISITLIYREYKEPIFSEEFWKSNNEDVFAGLEDRIK